MKIKNKHKAKLLILAWLMSFEVYISGRQSEESFIDNHWPNLEFTVKDQFYGIKKLTVSPNGDSDIMGTGGKYVMYCFDDLSYANGHYLEVFPLFLDWEWVEIPDEAIARIKEFCKI